MQQLTFSGARDRLDRFVAGELAQVSRSQIKRLIKQGLVTVNGMPVKPGYLLREGDKIEVRVPSQESPQVRAVNFPLTVLYESPEVVVVNKPAGVPVHPGHGHRDDTVVNALLARYPDMRNLQDQERLGIVHRLDMDTSGVLVVARNESAQRFLQAQFKARTVQKVYIVLAEGHLTPAYGAIEAPVGRDPRNRKRMAVVAEGGRDARTEYHVLKHLGDYTLLEAYPRTGRTHQIRVHLASIGHPVAGDAVYGSRKTSRLFPRQFLHALRVCIVLPGSNSQREFEAELPDDLRQSLYALNAEAQLG
jgi:23S rRNA pseudouridine1911/1915/1917 synthase